MITFLLNTVEALGLLTAGWAAWSFLSGPDNPTTSELGD